MVSTTSVTGDTSSKQQQAQRKQKYKRQRPVSLVNLCHPYRRKREAVTNPTHVAVYLFRGQHRDRSRLKG